jgi:hypothetical protein
MSAVSIDVKVAEQPKERRPLISAGVKNNSYGSTVIANTNGYSSNELGRLLKF